MQQVIGAVFAILGFSFLLWQMSPVICIGLVTYACFGTAISVCVFGFRIMERQNQRVKQEASLRYSLIRVRENAESIAFFEGGRAENVHFDGMFTTLLDTIYELVRLYAGVEVANRMFEWSTFAIVP